MSGFVTNGPVFARTYGLCTLLRALCEQGLDRGSDEIGRGMLEKGYLNMAKLCEWRCEEGHDDLIGLCQFSFGLERIGRNRWIDEILEAFEGEEILRYLGRTERELRVILLHPGSKTLLVQKQIELAHLKLGEIEQQEFLRLAHNGALVCKQLMAQRDKRDNY